MSTTETVEALSLENEVFIKQVGKFSYRTDAIIGQGYSSTVFLGKDDESGDKVAVKVINLKKINDEVLRSMLLQEIESLRALKDSPNILKFYDAVTTANHTYIITQLCTDSDLAHLIMTGCLYEKEAARLMRQIVKGYMEIYRKNIVHRDLKPSNIFIKETSLLIADFGFSAKEVNMRQPCNYNVGSPLYMPPEALTINQYSFKSDIWSLGIIYYEMLFGHTPWAAHNQKQLSKTIIQNPILAKIPRVLTKTSMEFLFRALDPNLETRLSPDELENWSFELDDCIRYNRLKLKMKKEQHAKPRFQPVNNQETIANEIWFCKYIVQSIRSLRTTETLQTALKASVFHYLSRIKRMSPQHRVVSMVDRYMRKYENELGEVKQNFDENDLFFKMRVEMSINKTQLLERLYEVLEFHSKADPGQFRQYYNMKNMMHSIQ